MLNPEVCIFNKLKLKEVQLKCTTLNLHVTSKVQWDAADSSCFNTPYKNIMFCAFLVAA